MEVFLSIVLLVFGVLQIILFFKLWGMTNNTKEIKKLLKRADARAYMEKNPELPGWCENVRETEKLDALDLVLNLTPKHVVV